MASTYSKPSALVHVACTLLLALLLQAHACVLQEPWSGQIDITIRVFLVQMLSSCCSNAAVGALHFEGGRR